MTQRFMRCSLLLTLLLMDFSRPVTPQVDIIKRAYGDLFFGQNLLFSPLPLSLPVFCGAGTNIALVTLAMMGTLANLLILLEDKYMVKCLSQLSSNSALDQGRTSDLFSDQQSQTYNSCKGQDGKMLPPYRTLCPPGVGEMLLIMAGDVEQNPGPPKRNGATKQESPSLLPDSKSPDVESETIALPSEDICADLSSEALDSVWTENDLARLAQHMINWEKYCAYLGLSDPEEEEIKHDNPKYAIQKYKALLRWKKKGKEKATYRQLIKLFLRLKETEMAYKVRKILLYPETAPNIESLEMEQYHNYLQLQYKQLPHPCLLPDQWPHGMMKSSVYIDLELRQVTVEEEDEKAAFEKGISKRKIVLHELFEQENGKLNSGQRIIIRGNPGSGKTTLTWQASRQWSNGKIFQHFLLFLSISLRSPKVQQARHLADLIPHLDERQRKAMAEAISIHNGRGVCFWFDSWDDLPQDLQQESFIAHFIRGDQSGEFLPECNIVITTRPETEYLGESFGFEVEICELSTQQANEIIVQTTSGTDHDPELLIDHIGCNVELVNFCSLPINVVILVHIFFAVGSNLPNTQTKLFEYLVLNLLLRNIQMKWKHSIRKLRKFSDLPESPKKCFDSLCMLAFNGIVKTKTVFTPSDFSCEVPVSLATMGLMRVAPIIDAFGVEEELSFVHITLQEFLAAIHLSTLSSDQQVQVIKELVESKQHLPTVTFFAGLTQFSNKDVFFLVEEICREKHYELDNCGNKTLTINNRDHSFFMIINCIYEAQSSELCRFIQPKSGPFNMLEFRYFGGPAIWFMRHMQLLGYFLGHYCLTTHCTLNFETHFFQHHPKGIKLLIHQIKSSWKSAVPKQTESNHYIDPLYKFFSGVNVVRGYNKLLTASPENMMQYKMSSSSSPLTVCIDDWDIDVVKGFGQLVRDTDIVNYFGLRFDYRVELFSNMRLDYSQDHVANQCVVMKELVETMSRNCNTKSRDCGCKELCLTFAPFLSELKQKIRVLYAEYYAVLLLLFSQRIEIMCFLSFFQPSLSNYSLFTAALQYTRIGYLDLSGNDVLSDAIVRNISQAVNCNKTLERLNLTGSLTSSQLTIVLHGINVLSRLEAVYTSLEPSLQHQSMVTLLNNIRVQLRFCQFPHFYLIVKPFVDHNPSTV